MNDDDNSENTPLRVISKIEWLEWKKKFKELSKLVTRGFSSTSIRHTSQDSAVLTENTLLKFRFVDRFTDKTNVVTKRDIKLAVMHCTTPAYVDLAPNSQSGVIRFFNTE